MKETRLTSARQAILETLEGKDHHLTAAQIHEMLIGRLPSLSLSTAYRSLEYLVEHRLISVSDIGIGTPVYERLSEEPHHHLVCLNCHQILRLEHDLVAPFFQTLEDDKQFTVQTNHLVLYGLCKNCKSNE